ncbi:putative ribosomal protein P2 [Apostichopus japonicus]|uniref:Large ribosomal subunit protein P2 n=1 Tax=Stichopus japonicus TaxID=307972 RepID=A0A2G8KUX1_STIJA|nr:putative ribosomal protein P2 [Apostichopus japonicus]
MSISDWISFHISVVTNHDMNHFLEQGWHFPGEKTFFPTSVRYVAAYLLAALGGNNSPSSDDIKKILGSVGIEAEDDKLNKVISELKGKNLEELIAEGNGKLASMPLEEQHLLPVAAEEPPQGAPLRKRRKRRLRRKNPMKNLMMTWDSVSLTKEKLSLSVALYITLQ